MTRDSALCIFHCKVSGSQFLLYSDLRYVAYPEQSIISYYLCRYLCHIYLANRIIALSITASFVLIVYIYFSTFAVLQLQYCYNIIEGFKARC